MLNPTDPRRAVYRRGSVPHQVDHPGWLSKVVEDQSQLEDALAEGWTLEMQDATPPQRDVPTPAVDGPSSDEIRDADVPVSEHAPKKRWTKRKR